MIEAQGVTVSIGGKTIVDNMDFTARPGTLTAIVGPNGSGKTTFFRALCGELPYSGRIRLNEADVATMKPARAAWMRAVLPQATALSFPFTVREIVRLGLTAGRSGAHPDEMDTLAENALSRVDLAGFEGRFYQELSGGEQQRVQLARVLCQVWAPVLDDVPRFLLLDEPVSSLDIKHQLVIMRIARDFARQGGGVVAILHDLNLTAMYAERVHIIHAGRLAAAGTPRDVLTDKMIADVFDCDLRVGVVPDSHIPFVLPQSASGG